jgi:hypothetical protein
MSCLIFEDRMETVLGCGAHKGHERRWLPVRVGKGFDIAFAAL